MFKAAENERVRGAQFDHDSAQTRSAASSRFVQDADDVEIDGASSLVGDAGDFIIG